VVAHRGAHAVRRRGANTVRVACLAAALLLAGCFSDRDGASTDAGASTDLPVATDTPAVTDAGALVDASSPKDVLAADACTELRPCAVDAPDAGSVIDAGPSDSGATADAFTADASDAADVTFDAADATLDAPGADVGTPDVTEDRPEPVDVRDAAVRRRGTTLELNAGAASMRSANYRLAIEVRVDSVEGGAARAADRRAVLGTLTPP